MTVDISEHGRRDVDREDVVGIGEETDTSNADNLDVEPTRSNLSETVLITGMQLWSRTRTWRCRSRQERRADVRQDLWALE